MGLFKREKREIVGLDLQNPDNQRAALQASLDSRVMLYSKGHGLFIVDTKSARWSNVEKFFRQFVANSVNCHQGLIDDDDPKVTYILIYDKEEKKDGRRNSNR